MQPLVSVCIITYQHAAYIRQCLESVCTQQTTFPFEVLVSDHSSTDGTWEICQQLQNEYPHLLRLRQHPREDITMVDGRPTGGANLLACLSWAQAPYIALCEGDDYWCDIHKLELCIQKLLEKPEIALIVNACRLWEQEKQEWASSICTTEHQQGDIEYFICQDSLYTASSMTFRNVGTWESIKPLLSKSNRLDDLLCIHILGLGQVFYLTAPMTVYRKHINGSWNCMSQAQQLRHNIAFYRYLRQAYPHWTKLSSGCKQREKQSLWAYSALMAQQGMAQEMGISYIKAWLLPGNGCKGANPWSPPKQLLVYLWESLQKIWKRNNPAT